MKHVVYRLAVICAFLAPSITHAHHSLTATFQEGATIEVQGVVTRYNFKNPHVIIQMDVVGEDGTITNWMSEGAAATNLRRAGWDRDSFKEGDVIRITGDSTRDGSPMVSIEEARLISAVDGSVVRVMGEDAGDQGNEVEGPPGFRGIPVKKAPLIPLTLEDGQPNLTGAWTGYGSPYAPPFDPTLPFNEAGAKLKALYDDANDPQVFCDPPGLIRQTGMTPHPVRITQYDDRVEFEYEEYGGKKIVYFDPSKGVRGIATHFGDSVASYEDGALVVKTHNLLSDYATAEGNRLSDQATVTQYYTRVDEEQYGSMMMITTVVQDPVYLTEDFVLENVKINAGEYEFIDNECSPPLRERQEVHPSMSFFLTSDGMGDGANLGGLEGADAHCQSLAAAVGAGNKNWHAYLSTSGEGGVNARDRIGSGPWYNARGIPIAKDVEDLHGANNNVARATVVSERAGSINARGDEPNQHDILTGSHEDGTALSSDSDTTCGNWTSNASDGSALVGHFDRVGGGPNPTSWNSAHASRGCSQENLQATGGDGLFYCFAEIE